MSAPIIAAVVAATSVIGSDDEDYDDEDFEPLFNWKPRPPAPRPITGKDFTQ